MFQTVAWRRILCATSIVMLATGGGASAQSQAIPRSTPLTLAEARQRARAIDASMVASAEAIAAARGRTRQAGAMPNPVLAWSREQASGHGLRNTQDILTLEQRLDVGLRRASREVAMHNESATLAGATHTAAQLDYQVAEAFWSGLAGDLRTTAIDRALADYRTAAAASQARLTAGDVSAYADRRLQVELVRLGTYGVQVTGQRERARFALLALLTGENVDRPAALALQVDTVLPSPVTVSVDSLLGLALARRADLQAARAIEDAAHAGVTVAQRERIPAPAAMLGYKREETGSDALGLSGLVVGLSLPLPLWDRRAGSIDAAAATARRYGAEVLATERRVRREVIEAHTSYQSANAQLERLTTLLTSDTRATLAAIDIAYGEGEATLVEWLDAKRAWLDLQLLRADVLEAVLISRAALERATGAPLP